MSSDRLLYNNKTFLIPAYFAHTGSFLNRCNWYEKFKSNKHQCFGKRAIFIQMLFAIDRRVVLNTSEYANKIVDLGTNNNNNNNNNNNDYNNDNKNESNSNEKTNKGYEQLHVVG